MYGESAFGSIPFDTEKVAAGLQEFIDNEICIVSDSEGVNGFLLAYFDNPWYMPDRFFVAREELLYVKPEHRAHGIASDLINCLVSVAKSMNAAEVRINTGTGVKQSSFDKMATSLGFTQFGTDYRMVCNG